MLAILDPGHGGHAQRGSSSPSGERFADIDEKAINLELARRTARRLGRAARLTRVDDVNLAIGERVRIAADARARAFVSLHAGGVPPGEIGLYGHRDARGEDRRLLDELARAIARTSGRWPRIEHAELAVLDPGSHDPGTARCLVEIGGPANGYGGRYHATLDAHACGLAHGLARFLGSAPAYGRNLPRLRTGEYALALDGYLRMIDDDAEVATIIGLLQRSGNYLAAVGRVEPHTIASEADSPLFQQLGYTDIVNGRVITGPHTGKWILSFAAWVNLGARFVPGTSPEAPYNANFISVEGVPRDGTPEARGRFIHDLIHETFHFDAAVSARFPRGSTLASEIQAAIGEEIWVRQQTIAATNQIGTPAALRGFTFPTPVTAARDVERDFRSGDDTMTYLESFVFGFLIRQAIAAEGLTPQDVSALQQRVDAWSAGVTDTALVEEIGATWLTIRDPALGIYVMPPPQGALALHLRRKSVQARWRRAIAAGLDPQTKESMLQEHARLVFPQGVTYAP